MRTEAVNGWARAAWRWLGAIVGPRDQSEARQVRAEGAAADRDAIESQVYLGGLALDAGDWQAAEVAFRSVLDHAMGFDGPCVWAKFGLGDVRVAVGDRDEALRIYQDAQATARVNAARKPNDTQWQRSLSVSHIKIGDVQRTQGNLAAALRSYEAGLVICQRLAARDPANVHWRRDLANVHNKVGDVLVARGDFAAALAQYQRGCKHARRLADQEPDNAEWQRDLIVSHRKLATVYEASEKGRVHAHYREALAICERLVEAGRLAPADAWMVEDLRARVDRTAAAAD